ncbi:MAG: prepilin-type N-terminal cleavage/methylation domain-containing protein [Methylotenera sp.]|nr:prepilin-type N-terminal cleavage/methylation domain-containing protein [Methylotenera sp.]
MKMITEKKHGQNKSRVLTPLRCIAHFFSELLCLALVAMPLKNCIAKTQYRRHGGFTLLELLVTLTLLALVAGASVMALDGVDDDAKPQIVQNEMFEISKAISRFRKDTGYYPPQDHPADFSALFSSECPFLAQPALVHLCTKNPDTGRFWRGPYLASQGIAYLDIGYHDDAGVVAATTDAPDYALALDGTGSPVVGALMKNIQAKADLYERVPAGSYLAWHSCNAYNNYLLPAIPNDADCEAVLAKYGRPYLLFDLNDNNKARLVSMGADGEYGGVNAANVCLPNVATSAGKDDLVLCLK